MRPGRLCLWIILLSSTSARAQISSLGSWTSGTISLPGSAMGRLGANAQAEVRDNEILKDFAYLEIKGALTYFCSRHFSVALGGGQYTTYQDETLKKSTTVERRLYEQVSNNEFFSWIKLENRISIEQRWMDGVYYNRFRYRLTAFVPINRRKIEPHTFFVSGFEEVFITNQNPCFQLNRCYGGAGYQLDKSWIFQAGFTNQYSPGLTRSFATLMLLYRISRRNQVKRDFMPSVMN
jgi:hypothetical protein